MPLPNWQWASYKIQRNGKPKTIEILYSLDFDQYEGTTWVDIHRIYPYVELTSKELMIFREEVLGD